MPTKVTIEEKEDSLDVRVQFAGKSHDRLGAALDGASRVLRDMAIAVVTSGAVPGVSVREVRADNPPAPAPAKKKK